MLLHCTKRKRMSYKGKHSHSCGALPSLCRLSVPALYRVSLVPVFLYKDSEIRGPWISFVITFWPSLPSPAIYAASLEAGIDLPSWWKALSLRSTLFSTLQQPPSNGARIIVTQGKIILRDSMERDIQSFSLGTDYRRSQLRESISLIGSCAPAQRSTSTLRLNMGQCRPVSRGGPGVARSSRKILGRPLIDIPRPLPSSGPNLYNPSASEFAIVGRSNSISSDSKASACFEAPDSRPDTSQGDDPVAMDIQSAAPELLLLFKAMSRTCTSDSAPSHMPAPSFRSSSSSAQSSPLCSTPELPPVTFPSLSQSSSPSLYGGINGPLISDVYHEKQKPAHSVSLSTTESFLERMTLDHNTPPIHANRANATRLPLDNHYHQNSATPSRPSSTPSSVASDDRTGKECFCYLSRSQRRLSPTATQSSRPKYNNLSTRAARPVWRAGVSCSGLNLWRVDVGNSPVSLLHLVGTRLERRKNLRKQKRELE
ncbi:hypothetical protein D9757_000872 [Collybiopsis confluens]|uniref:Uncharacterized protein n=1 Tax=Collybiopsis confluens TaxID=2823264 RepID=A0A8H5MFN7_9AGAR|nr:hypothetical protein D9757_000872 [Collybiopsis confluens]